MAKIQSHSIFKRTKNGKKLPYYYCRFLYTDGTEKTISTKKTNKDAAREFVSQLIINESEKEERISIEMEKALLRKQREELEAEKHQMESLRSRIDRELSIPTMAEYDGFFIYGGKWCKLKDSQGKSVSERHCLDRVSLFKNHVLPFWKEYRISEVTAASIADFRIYLHTEKHLEGKTINASLTTLKEILIDAVLNEYIQSIPMIQRFSAKSKGKGILTSFEKTKLFPADWEKVWCRTVRNTVTGPNKQDLILRERDKFIYAINLFSYDTGCRMGECQALKLKKIDFKNMTVLIDSAHDNRCRRTNDRTKTGIVRQIPLTRRCLDIISILIKDRDPDAYIFSYDGIVPIEKNSISNGMYRALHRIGISEEERRRRNVSFHSYRYMYNSDLMEGGVGKEITQKVTGHVTDEMTLKYLKISDFSKVRNVIEKRTILEQHELH